MKLDNIFLNVNCFLLLFLFCGCSGFNELPDKVDAEWKPIEVSSCRAQLGVNVVTHASGLTEIKTGTLGLYRKATNGYKSLNNVRYTYKEATDEIAARWESDDAAKAIYVNGATANIYAVYPYMEINGAPTNGHSFDGTNVAGMHQQRYYSDSRNEVMISGERSANNRAPRLELIMMHIYSRLTVRIKNAEAEALVIKSLTFKPKADYAVEAMVDISTIRPLPVVTATSGEGYSYPFEDTDNIYTSGIASGVVDESIDMIWIPQTFTAGMEISIEVEGVVSETKWKLSTTISQTDLPKLDPETRYILPLKIIGPAKLIIDGNIIKNNIADTPTDPNIKFEPEES